MTDQLLTVLRLVFLGLLYLFLWRVIRVSWLDLYGPRKRTPLRKVADAPRPTSRSRRPPRELVVEPPVGPPQIIELTSQTVKLGREPAAADNCVLVALLDQYVSDEHAEVAVDGPDWVIEDLGSTNGTYLNGSKVSHKTPLSAGDQIRLGKTRIEARR